MPLTQEAENLQRVYRRRFGETAAYRNRVWGVLTKSFLGVWVRSGDVVLDLGCGYGEFINNIRASEKLAMDLNPDAAQHLADGVRFLEQDCSLPWPLADGTLDSVFTSNFLEHLPDKAAMSRTLAQAFRCLKPGGRFIALGPNIKYLAGAYWDFFDHFIPLTEASLGEALEIEGFILEKVVPRFLPYTLANGRRYPLFLLQFYLALPFLWWFRGRQFLLIARRPAA
jgi:SAM-dependent methyltransferase